MEAAATNALVSNLGSPPAASKKYRLTVMGMAVAVFLFLITALIFVCNPAAMLPLLDFARSVITAVAGIVATGLAGLAFVDYRTSASLASK